MMSVIDVVVWIGLIVLLFCVLFGSVCLWFSFVCCLFDCLLLVVALFGLVLC